MSLELLVSTMDQSDDRLLEKMKINSNAIIINQCSEEITKKLDHNNHIVKWMNTNARGLSKSRNQAIREATGDICLLADDDLVYVDHYERRILEQFDMNRDTDILVFQVLGIERHFKNYALNAYAIGYINSLRVSSVQIAFRNNRMKELGIYFDERFGSGSRFYSGEENIFLFDCLRRGLKIKYVPIKIAHMHIGESSWFEGYNKQYFVSKGAAYTRMTQLFSYLLIIQFALLKYRLYAHDMHLLSAIKHMLEGKREYLKTRRKRYNDY